MALAGSRFYRRPHVHAPVSHPFGPFLPLSRPKLSRARSDGPPTPGVCAQAPTHWQAPDRFLGPASLTWQSTRGRSRPRRLGRPRVDCQVRDLIRQMSKANPLRGAPRIHGELLKLGIRIGQTAVAKYMARRPHPPSSSWRTFLNQHVGAIAAIDMFIVVSATFQMLYVVIVLRHGRRKIAHFEVTRHPTQVWLALQVTEAFPW